MYQIGEDVCVTLAGPVAAYTAGSAPEGSEVAGRILDLWALPLGQGGYDSVSLELPWEASIGTKGDTLSFAANFETGDDDGLTDAADIGTALPATIMAMADDAIVDRYGVCKGPSLDVKLAKRYLRVQVTAALSAATTDTVGFAPVLVFRANKRPAR